jgi:hypothetical protein
MSLQYIQKNLFDVDMSDGNHIIAHVTNNQNVWGAGFVIPLGQHYPEAKERYLKYKQTLGKVQMVECSFEIPSSKKNIFVANMCAQTLDNVPRPLQYDKLVRCMEAVAEAAKVKGSTIEAPLFGAGLAGASWEFIHELIMDIWVANDIKVNVYWIENMLPHPLLPKDFGPKGRFGNE